MGIARCNTVQYSTVCSVDGCTAYACVSVEENGMEIEIASLYPYLSLPSPSSHSY